MKNTITGSDFINLCKKNNLIGSYIFFDDEDYMKRHCLSLAKKTLLDEDTADFNYIKIDCEDDPAWLMSLRDALETPPMFAERKLIVVRDINIKAADSDEGFWDMLSELEKITDITVILVPAKEGFDTGKLPKAPSALFKKTAKLLTPVSFQRESPARLNAWVAKRFALDKILCDASCAKAIVDYVSPNMTALAGECEKLICYIKSLGENKVLEEYIYKVCVPLKIEGEFDLSNALLDGDYARCIELVFSMKRRKERPEMVYTQIGGYVINMYTVKVFADSGLMKSEIAKKTGIHEYRVGMYLSAIDRRHISSKRLGYLLEKCREADRRIKSTNLDSFEVLENLVYEVCL
ncbi:MAG: DNA polymerase III subunit delta [Ruminococcaceae bacterium]|nr:DNA polymerase III subunit delta [Oscillospiraceae bacterium]